MTHWSSSVCLDHWFCAEAGVENTVGSWKRDLSSHNPSERMGRCHRLYWSPVIPQIKTTVISCSSRKSQVVILSCLCPPGLQAGLGSHFKGITQPPSPNLKDERETFLGLTPGDCSGFLLGVATQVCRSLLCPWPSRAEGSSGTFGW